jgi:hypothetical protein
MFQIKFVDKTKTHILYSVTFSSKNYAVYEILSKNVVEPERLQVTIWRRVACWIIKITYAQAHFRARVTDLTKFLIYICIVFI